MNVDNGWPGRERRVSQKIKSYNGFKGILVFLGSCYPLSMQILVPITLFFALHTFAQIYPLKHHHPTTTKVMQKRKRDRPKLEIKSNWAKLEEIPPHLIESVFFVEDQDFYSHHGVSLRKIRCAYNANKYSQKITHGGSTLTQQIAKNLFLHSRRTYTRKIHEAWIALFLEFYLTKERLLEIYLNIVEWGPGIFGIEEAAQHWFGKHAQSLTGLESVQLAMILSDPLNRTPHTLPNYLQGLSNHLLTILAGKKMITHDELMSSLYLPPNVLQQLKRVDR